MQTTLGRTFGTYRWGLVLQHLGLVETIDVLQEAGFVYGGNEGGTGDLLEVDNDVLFREGLTMKGEVTYTPRMLSLDLQGSLGLLPQCGELYGRFTDESSLPKIW